MSWGVQRALKTCCGDIMYDLYEESRAWSKICKQSYTMSQQMRTLACLLQEPAADGFGYVTTLALQHDGENTARACIPREADILEEVYGLQGHESWIEVRPPGGQVIRCDVNSIDSLPIIALQGCAILLFVKPARLGEDSWCLPCLTVRYSCVQSRLRTGLVNETQHWKGHTLKDGRFVQANEHQHTT